MLVETWPISRLMPYLANARKITQKAIDKVARSLQEYGWRQPIVVDAHDVIIVGHVRRLAALQLGWTECPVHVADNLTPAQVRAYRLMDNRSNDEVEFDLDLLGLELGELKALKLDLSLTGFDSRELDVLLRTPDERADDAPPLPASAVTRPGDLWLMGQHRILCGDATSAEDVGRLLDGRQPSLMVTDPPYGVDYHPEWRLETGLNKPWQTRAEGRVGNDEQVDWSSAYRNFNGDVAYIWHAGRHAGEVAIGIHSCGFEIRNQIIWAKPSLVIGRGNYHWQHEPCWYAVRKGKRSNWSGDRTQSTLWSVPNMHRTQGNVDDGHTVHSTQKPVELSRRPLLNHTEKGEGVYDPFLGSGSTLIAAQELERICYGLEIDPRYCDVIIQRWQSFCGKEATLENAHSATFEHVKEGRRLEAEDAIKEEVFAHALSKGHAEQENAGASLANDRPAHRYRVR